MIDIPNPYCIAFAPSSINPPMDERHQGHCITIGVNLSEDLALVGRGTVEFTVGQKLLEHLKHVKGVELQFTFEEEPPE